MHSFILLFLFLTVCKCLSQSTSAHSSFHYRWWSMLFIIFCERGSFKIPLISTSHTHWNCDTRPDFPPPLLSSLISFLRPFRTHPCLKLWLTFLDTKAFVWPFASAEKRSDDKTSNVSKTKPTYDINVKIPPAPKTPALHLLRSPVPLGSKGRTSETNVRGAETGETTTVTQRGHRRFFVFPTPKMKPKPMDKRTWLNWMEPNKNQILGADVEEQDGWMMWCWSENARRGSDSEMVPSSPPSFLFDAFGLFPGRESLYKPHRTELQYI